MLKEETEAEETLKTGSWGRSTSQVMKMAAPTTKSM